MHPPYIPYAPAFAAAGVDPWALHTIANCGDEGLWAAEQCLRSATCALVACWPGQVNDRQLRRLQLAAESGKAIGVVFRTTRIAMTASPAAVRLHANADGIQVLKCRGGNSRQQRIATQALHLPQTVQKTRINRYANRRPRVTSLRSAAFPRTEITEAFPIYPQI